MQITRKGFLKSVVALAGFKFLPKVAQKTMTAVHVSVNAPQVSAASCWENTPLVVGRSLLSDTQICSYTVAYYDGAGNIIPDPAPVNFITKQRHVTASHA